MHSGPCGEQVGVGSISQPNEGVLRFAWVEGRLGVCLWEAVTPLPPLLRFPGILAIFPIKSGMRRP